jgi:hypothetical protein
MPSTYTLYNAFVDETCKEAYESRGESAGAVHAMKSVECIIDLVDNARRSLLALKQLSSLH